MLRPIVDFLDAFTSKKIYYANQNMGLGNPPYTYYMPVTDAPGYLLTDESAAAAQSISLKGRFVSISATLKTGFIPPRSQVTVGLNINGVPTPILATLTDPKTGVRPGHQMQSKPIPGFDAPTIKPEDKATLTYTTLGLDVIEVAGIEGNLLLDKVPWRIRVLPPNMTLVIPGTKPG